MYNETRNNMNNKIEYREYPQGNREHKSTLFCKAFEQKKHLLKIQDVLIRVLVINSSRFLKNYHDCI